ncbi:hypothetical protein [Bradyrhizobium acaciae]|uniref:hypothetical protein n=1 Tax=Bradyrhizobium acaciae TaxID=2683706 RepID=UPI001E4DB9A5|nr:hypothetical protein [Bradyrhizobium acaciae]MCC8977306.1 hypothetical protein [Bradyrhizobium acaciae]
MTALSSPVSEFGVATGSADADMTGASKRTQAENPLIKILFDIELPPLIAAINDLPFSYYNDG